MGSTTEAIPREQVSGDDLPLDDLQKSSVLQELETILSSPFFQASRRCKQFLSYVVHHRLEGNHDRLKERTIGVELFQRPLGYATGDDPVVRVQAGEVRRRLEQYYHATPSHSTVRIELPVGSYAPRFRWAEPQQLESPQNNPQPQDTLPPPSHEQEASQATIPVTADLVQQPGNRSRRRWALLVVAFAVAVSVALIAWNVYRAKASKTVLEEFWSPPIASSEPYLICMAKPTVYLPSAKLYDRHSKTPGKFQNIFERLTQTPALQPDDKLVWGDMEKYPDYGLATGDVYAAIRLSTLLGQIGKRSQVRIGDSYSFEDLRYFPAIVIGAFNNRWTMQMTSNLHFGFIAEGGESFIREQGPSGRQWRSKSGANGASTEDFGIVTRLLNSKTGQFVVAVAGVKSYGTQAAGELVTSEEYLEKALRAAPPDWRRKNIQIVVQTTVTDSISGPPQTVAVYVW
ncbi:hypothetical protein [Acidicapsa acidisoli]|uniref:hypothetical protein n=1 Tax=Acidicapsa acidisoli TaxID=1615681 RepID=UPI0021E0AEFC|nr:hypothetical protein [Acidicapsa acidisoli]